MKIEKQIPVSAVRDAFVHDGDLRFICYGVSKILNAEFEFDPTEDRGWACYEMIQYRHGRDTLANQINLQLFHFMVQLGFLEPQPVDPVGFEFDDFYQRVSGETIDGVTFEECPRKFRIQIMEFICAVNPNATFSVTLGAYIGNRRAD